VLFEDSRKKTFRAKRMQCALQLLEQNTGTVAEIAFTVGFGSPAYFTKSFREEFRISPSEVGDGEGGENEILLFYLAMRIFALRRFVWVKLSEVINFA
jgi:AraC-like DNA-binding protein